jgi:hypothetical protein
MPGTKSIKKQNTFIAEELKEKISEDQKRAAVGYYLKHGRNVPRTVKR